MWAALVCILCTSAASSARAAPSACRDLLDHPRVERAAGTLSGASFRTIDLSRRGLLRRTSPDDGAALGATMDDYLDAQQTLRVVALDLPRGAPLVEVTCAIGKRMRLSVRETLVVVSPVGLHAYSGSLTYRELRVLARRHNPDARRHPARASAALARDILALVRRRRHERARLGWISAISFALAAAALAWLLRRSQATSRDASAG